MSRGSFKRTARQKNKSSITHIRTLAEVTERKRYKLRLGLPKRSAKRLETERFDLSGLE